MGMTGASPVLVGASPNEKRTILLEGTKAIRRQEFANFFPSCPSVFIRGREVNSSINSATSDFFSGGTKAFEVPAGAWQRVGGCREFNLIGSKERL
jgi:hypothetical protein